MDENKLDLILSEIGGLRSEVGGLRSEVGGLRSVVGGLQSEMNDMKSEMADMKSEIKSMRSEFTEKFQRVDDEFRKVHTRFDHNERMIGQLIHMVGEQNKANKEIRAEQNTLEHSVDILNRRQLRMEADIEALKKK
ncbi:hypothetical protein [Paenibacillus ehimensis]|uniref:Uncharacterized protein n=1 Tax=Paenibacillus ehimensis TaxID=79264 RepID=A0ABT8VCL7_9BACL|nr:hypothetical protein [Paenibacillus ehimensis]MDO3678700.1 hypothetical protein [Paenibacillus ehimensis]MEC0212637.1 hypothetical protein [Paenibacillus ehimensis]